MPTTFPNLIRTLWFRLVRISYKSIFMESRTERTPVFHSHPYESAISLVKLIRNPDCRLRLYMKSVPSSTAALLYRREPEDHAAR